MTNVNNKVEADGYALNASQNNPSISGSLAKRIADLNTSKLRNNGYYGPDVSINDMLDEGITRFYVNTGTANANYLGWTGRTIILCTGNCAGYIHQIFFSDFGNCAYRRNKDQNIFTFTYDLPLYRIDSRLDVPQKINITSTFSNKIAVYQIGKVVSVDIDGYITAYPDAAFASGFPKPVNRVWVQDLAGHGFTLNGGELRCNEELNNTRYVNLHFTYITI